MFAMAFVQAVVEEIRGTGPATLMTVGAFAAAVAWNLRETIKIGKKVSKVCERFVHTPTTEYMNKQIAREVRAVRDDVTDICTDVQIENSRLSDEIEGIKLYCAERRGKNGAAK